MLLPDYVVITDGNVPGSKVGGNNVAWRVLAATGIIVVADCCDFDLLSLWDSNDVFLVVRHKEELSFRTIKSPVGTS